MIQVAHDHDAEVERRLRGVECRLNRVLSDGLGKARSPAMRNVITAAIEQMQTEGPAPRFSLLTEAYALIAEAGRMNRSMRETKGGDALAQRLGIDSALVTDELSQAEDALAAAMED